MNLTGIAFESQLPIDKIVNNTAYKGSFTVGGFNNSTFDPGTGQTVVTHNLNKKCFPELLWSTDNVNFMPAPQEDSNRVAALAACGLNTCTIYGYQSAGTSAVTVFYILYLIWPN